ncbi:hypothetical protein TREMEDRAFT_59697 [Tremella mesenterica DSM 1558]|uniref:uncharacterized protein n=1 Tax=Tremella mesenterica (strain ATCC 24925 / CBS 8224 / DSM 1558 / NBRC 9311 / NRRL Y-6157 / RJB 2259-6 / UBC 559-6) TaxID=578456 RepID=UPI0003F494AC|nr:uncharacterized protein TREMEDRAFT_59697 [Tremella mesenterica DSM 1558]EIW73524.1 hypothetical protein TREMEDRAFT_59697 [Tremella mesenterica DSM 1558]
MTEDDDNYKAGQGSTSVVTLDSSVSVTQVDLQDSETEQPEESEKTGKKRKRKKRPGHRGKKQKPFDGQRFKLNHPVFTYTLKYPTMMIINVPPVIPHVNQNQPNTYFHVLEDILKMEKGLTDRERGLDMPEGHKLGQYDFCIPHPCPKADDPRSLFTYFKQFFPPESRHFESIQKSHQDFSKMESQRSIQKMKNGKKVGEPEYHLGISARYLDWNTMSDLSTRQSYLEGSMRKNREKVLPLSRETIKSLLFALRQATGGTLYHKLGSVDSPTSSKMRIAPTKLLKVQDEVNPAKTQVPNFKIDNECFFGLNSMVTISQGKSINWHYDSPDSEETYTVIIVGGKGNCQIHIAQLGIWNLTLCPGDVVCYKASKLLHSIMVSDPCVLYTFHLSSKSVAAMGGFQWEDSKDE